MKNNTAVDPANSDFGTILNCAVRYSLGRQTYMPGLVIDFITPLLSHLDDRTLHCFDQDITDAQWSIGYGDPKVDEPRWHTFLEAVHAERLKRGHKLYKSPWKEVVNKGGQ